MQNRAIGRSLVATALGVSAAFSTAMGQDADDQVEVSVDENLALMARGAIVVSASANELAALALTDGDPASRWSSPTRRIVPPYVFVVELMAPAEISAVGITGAGERPGGVVGGSAGRVVFEGSSEGPDAGFKPLATVEAAAPDGVTLAETNDRPRIRWLRVFVESAINPEAAFLYVGDVVARGRFPDLPEEEGRFNGVFQTGRNDIVLLKQDGASVTGCYRANSGRTAGTLTGAVSEGVALVSWRSDDDITGTALFTIDSEGGLSGVRYRQRSRSAWGGPKTDESAAADLACANESESNPIADDLADDGIAQIYGIHFTVDSDVPKSSALPAMNQLREALVADQALRIMIVGHTDADGAADYNLDLSKRRAASVRNWLIEQGIAAGRLVSDGQGEAVPVASNDTADGKALNRRVEVRRLGE